MGSAYQFHSWRVFVLVCAFPSVSAIAALTTMPESPRFFLEVSQVQLRQWSSCLSVSTRCPSDQEIGLRRHQGLN